MSKLIQFRNGIAPRIGAAAMLGTLAWQGNAWLLLALPLVAWLWSSARSRAQAFVVMATYYLAAARCLVVGGAEFWGTAQAPNWAMGLLTWLLPNLFIAGIWALAWGKDRRPLRLLVALVITTVPPVGIIGWASPLAAAGMLFPGMGLASLVATAFLLCVLAAPASQQQRTVLLGIVCFAAINNLVYESPYPLAIMPVGTRFGAARDLAGEYDRLQELKHQVASSIKASAPGVVLLLPEAVVGDWTVAQGHLANLVALARRADVSVLVGAQQPTSGGKRINGLYRLGEESPRWTNRVPVPGGLWKPWSQGSVISAWWSAGVADLDGRRAAALICHEQILVWPALLSGVAGAEVFLAPSNLWFAQGTSLPAIEGVTSNAWGRMFGIPVVHATNF